MLAELQQNLTLGTNFMMAYQTLQTAAILLMNVINAADTALLILCVANL